MFSQVSEIRGPLTCTVSFVRDEEAAGSNPATPTQVRALIQVFEQGL